MTPSDIEGWSPQGAVEELSAADCWSRLSETPRGRLGVSADDIPGIYPVDYVVSDGTILFRTAEGEKLRRIRNNSRVVFEVDGDIERSAWSVVVTGIAREEDLDSALSDVASEGLPAWAPIDSYTFVRIVPTAVRGRRWAAPSVIERD